MSHTSLYLWAALGLIAVIVLAQAARHPGQVLGKLIRSAAAGCLFVLVVNWLGHYVQFHLPFNPFTALTAGLLGIPGVLALVVLHLWVVPG
ncbi:MULTISPECIES: pro-sigmaK processing inhibitor BofA family protein [Alicyclobacillus]|uniref:pro-sigmaK processing inhibitor BofA family protein n=1 Tax=Alicyclobacillus TaxID=29330 RepID=UPI00082B958E|nr:MULTISPECIES: pro-sigmaK processing inhibitor BofA family protein [Alicyclobacillus]MCL6626779.1 pro-sigmaK processing inhibitor BofA family protein [Alicyclobacillus shizuokensis]